VWRELFEKRLLGYALAVFGIAAATGALKLFGGHINSTTVAIVLLLIVLFIATLWGSRPAILASLLGVACFNFFFLPPVGTFIISDTDNLVALFAFLVTAITAGQLSSRARRRAEEANAGRREIERLYKELQDAFESASQAKAIQQSERLKSALLDAVTHDLRTPLTSIKASVTTLLDELHTNTKDAEQIELDREGRQEMLEVIDEEADRLNRFIEGLVELARIEAGEMHLRRRWASIEEIIETTLERAVPLTREHLIEVLFENELPSVRVDEKAVAEVIYTLLDNAAKYSPPGTTIRVHAERADDEMIELSVEDQGQGVPLNLRERVFDKFFRAMRDGDSGVSQPTGTGMGLAIAQGIVEAHGGRIWIEDGANKVGSRFVFRLPIGDDEQSVKSLESQSLESGVKG
jgi:two-component system sensor histidine kinase KdpD